MKAYIILAVSLVALSTASDSLAQTDLVLGARPQGLGGAYVALADDANGVYWNPAGLTNIGGGAVQFSDIHALDLL